MTRVLPRRRFLVQLFLILAVLGLVARCVPEKRVDLGDKATPLNWQDEDTYLYAQGGVIHAVNTSNRTTRLGTEQVPEWGEEVPRFDLEPADLGDFFEQDSYNYMMIAGEKVQVNRYGAWPRAGINQGFPRTEGIPFKTYSHLGKIGLIVFEGPVPTLINLPLRFPENTTAPFVVWDKHAGMFFALQTDCQYPKEDESCLRTGWWLDRDLSVVKTLALPKDDLLSVRGKLSCFSCGCGCFTHEDVYAVDGTVFFHVAGFPIPPFRRGLYELDVANDGSTRWRQVISGRIEPPLAFSPSGCRVAFYQVSFWGNSLEEEKLCSVGN